MGLDGKVPSGWEYRDPSTDLMGERVERLASSPCLGRRVVPTL